MMMMMMMIEHTTYFDITVTLVTDPVVKESY
jgi:hypothetical protein